MSYSLDSSPQGTQSAEPRSAKAELAGDERVAAVWPSAAGGGAVLSRAVALTITPPSEDEGRSRSQGRIAFTRLAPADPSSAAFPGKKTIGRLVTTDHSSSVLLDSLRLTKQVGVAPVSEGNPFADPTHIVQATIDPVESESTLPFWSKDTKADTFDTPTAIGVLLEDITDCIEDFKGKGYEIEEAVSQLAPLMTKHGAEYLKTVRHKVDFHGSEEMEKSGKWALLEMRSFTDARGHKVKYEVAQRRHRQAAASVIPTIHYEGKDENGEERPDETMITIQYRPPIGEEGSYSVEWPAGLVDDGEEPEQAAKREMEEEGGLKFDPNTDEVLGSSENVSKDGGFAGTEISDYFIRYKRHPTFKSQQNLDDASEGLEDELVERKFIPKMKFSETIRDLKQEGCSIDRAVGYHALLAELGQLKGWA